MEKIFEPRIILREGRDLVAFELNERELLIALLSNDILPLYASTMSKIMSLIIFLKQYVIIDVLKIGERGSYKGRPILRTPVSVRACVGVVKVTVPKLKDETWGVKVRTGIKLRQ